MAERFVELSAGQIWWARPDPTIGREQAGRRPVLVVAGQHYLEAVTSLVLAVPLTTTDRGWPNHVPLPASTGLPAPTFAMTEQVRAISRTRLDAPIGQVDAATLGIVRRWITDYLSD